MGITMHKKVAFYVALSCVIPVILRFLELFLTPFASRLFGISAIMAADGILLGISVIAVLICIKYHIQLGFSVRNINVDFRTALLFILALLPAIIMATRVSFLPDRFSFISTSISEELMCRGVWFSFMQKTFKKSDTTLLSYPVLLSSFFFVIWHVPFDLTAPSLFFVIAGIYSSLCLGYLREHSQSLYPGMAAHMLKLLIH